MTEKLTFRSYNLSSPISSPQHLLEIEGVYRLFKRVYDEEYDLEQAEWAKATPELFYINDKVIVLFNDDTPIAFVLCRYANLKLSAHYHQQWLEEWPIDILDQLKENTPEVIILNHLTVAPEFRKSRFSGLNIAVLMTNLIATHLVVSGEPVGLGTMKKNRGTPSLTSMIGGRCLKETQLINDVEAELVALYPADLSRYVDTLPTNITKMITEGTYYGYQTTKNTFPRTNANQLSSSAAVSLAR